MELTREEFDLLINIVEERRNKIAFYGCINTGSSDYDYTKTPGLNNLLDKLKRARELSW